jgi:ferredoxin
MRVALEPGRCQGHARCNAVAPDVFDLDDDGFVQVDGSVEVAAGREDSARRGAAACPERALTPLD